MGNLLERLGGLLALPPEELAAVSSELGDVLLQAREEGDRFLREGQDGKAEPLLRMAEALAVAGRRFDAAQGAAAFGRVVAGMDVARRETARTNKKASRHCDAPLLH